VNANRVEDGWAGTRRISRVNPVALAALRDQLETYGQRSLTRYADLAAEDTAPDPQEKP
jgi:hypothetical protein